MSDIFIVLMTISQYNIGLRVSGLSHAQYMPGVAGKLPDNGDIDEDVESDLKKMCSVQ